MKEIAGKTNTYRVQNRLVSNRCQSKTKCLTMSTFISSIDFQLGLYSSIYTYTILNMFAMHLLQLINRTQQRKGYEILRRLILYLRSLSQ